MILDRTWNKKERKLVLSYIDKKGDRQFYTKFLHHIKTYEYDPNGEYETWNGKRCNKVYKDSSTYEPNIFDILEFMYELPEDINKVMHQQNFPKCYAWDIETEVSDEFPDPELAKQKVTSISIVGPNLSCMVYGLHKMDDEKIQRLKQRYLDWINNNEFAKTMMKSEPQVLYKHFDTEEKMLEQFFTKIVSRIPVLIGWNAYNFDWQYIVNRIMNLFGKNIAFNMIRKASPTGELGRISWRDKDMTKHSIPVPKHSVIVDYMKIVENYDYILRPYESFSLDWVSSHAVNAHKVAYKGTLQDLYEKDYEWYYYYNAIDSLLVMLIHYKLKSLESPCAVSSLTFIPLLDAQRQTELTTANVFEIFYEDNKKVVYNYDEIERRKVAYKGAFVGCVPGRYELTVCDDFASLYPSQIITCNFSFENFMQKKVPNNIKGMPDIIVPWSEEELEKFKQDPNYFVSVEGNVYKNDKPYAFKRVMLKLKGGRAVYKYTGQKIDSELIPEIDRLIEEKRKVA